MRAKVKGISKVIKEVEVLKAVMKMNDSGYGMTIMVNDDDDDDDVVVVVVVAVVAVLLAAL